MRGFETKIMLEIVYLAVDLLRNSKNRSLSYSDEQIDKIAASISEFGFNNPLLVDADNVLITGHGRLRAAVILGLPEVPCIRINNVPSEQLDSYGLSNESVFARRAELCRLLDMSETNLTNVLRTLNIDYKTTPKLEVLKIYLRDIREKAAGRGGDHQIDAAIARTRKDNMSADMLKMQMEEKAGQLIPVSKIEPFIASLIIAARQQLINLPRMWDHEIQAGVTPDEQYFETDIHDALNQLSDVDVFGDEIDDASSDESLGSSRETADFAMGD